MLSMLRRITLLVALISSASLAGWAATKGPDAGGYAGTDETVYSFVDIAGGGGVSVLAGADDAKAALTLPFPFRFYGQPYTIACVSSNGALYFVATATECDGFVDFANTDLTSTATPRDLPAILPFWSDLTFEVAGGGAVFYQTIGVPGSRRFVVQWTNAYPQGSPNPVTFQAILSEGTNAVLFQYQSAQLGAGNPARSGAQATVGIRNAGAPANQQQVPWSFNAPVIADNSALLFAVQAASPCATDVTSAVRVMLVNVDVNPRTGRVVHVLRVVNKSSSPIEGPLSFVVDDLKEGASLLKPTGTTSCTSPAGSPFVTHTADRLPFEGAITFKIEFSAPGKKAVDYRPRLLAGTGNR
jgi:hypothetical protein